MPKNVFFCKDCGFDPNSGIIYIHFLVIVNYLNAKFSLLHINYEILCECDEKFKTIFYLYLLKNLRKVAKVQFISLKKLHNVLNEMKFCNNILYIFSYFFYYKYIF